MTVKYVLDADAKLPDDINIFYWMYPHSCSITIRDFMLFTPRGTFNKPAFFQTLKYFPVAYLISEIAEYDGLNTISKFRNCGLDDEVEIPIKLTRMEDPYWPEQPDDDDNNVFFGGESAMNAIHAKRRQ